MSVTCLHVAAGVCPACADRERRAGEERNHAEVWRNVLEIAQSALDDGKLPNSDIHTLMRIIQDCRDHIRWHEGRAERIEQGM